MEYVWGWGTRFVRSLLTARLLHFYRSTNSVIGVTRDKPKDQVAILLSSTVFHLDTTSLYYLVGTGALCLGIRRSKH